jgi:hypothetical protein
VSSDTENFRRIPERGIKKGPTNFRRIPERGIKKGSKMMPPPPAGGGFHLKGGKMDSSDIKPGYVYHIKDLYFDAAKDDKLMRNYEGGACRPTYFCVKDEKTGLLWVIPMSSRAEKYQQYVQKDIDRYGECLKIVIGDYADVKAAFLLQNMFPILPKYIDHIHLVKQNPVPVDTRLQTEISRNFRELLRLQRRGIKIVFTDILRLEELMINEMAEDREQH